MILVVGATGPVGLGFEICRRLRQAGRPVRAIARPNADQGKVAELWRLGVELAPGDLKDRRSLDAACSGVVAVISSATTTLSHQPGDTIPAVDQEGQLQLVDAARAAGVPRFLYVSYSGNFDDNSPLTTAKRTVERRLQRSGMAYTILRPSFFMEAWLSPALGFDIPSGQVRLYGSGERPISYISLFDVAQFAVTALDHPLARNAVLEIGGPAAVAPVAIVRLAEELSGRPFQVEKVPEEALRAQMAATTDPLQQSFAALMLGMAKGDTIDMREQQRTFAIPLTSVEEYVRRVLAGAPAPATA